MIGYIVFFIVAGIILLLVIINSIQSSNEADDVRLQQQSEKRKNVKDILVQNEANAVIFCQSESTLPRVPKGDLCYLIAEKRRLTIKTKTEPIMTYRLDYDKIYLFKMIETSKKETLDIGKFEVIEQKINHIVIQYIDEDNSIKELMFLFGNTDEDRIFNKYALRENNIFEVVESRIPRRDNDVML